MFMAAPPIENWVKLVPGVSVKLHFTDHVVADRVVTDPLFKVPKTVKGLVFRVDEVDGRPVELLYSVLSEKHAADFAGDLPGKVYTGYVYTIVKDAPGMVPPRVVEKRPR